MTNGEIKRQSSSESQKRISDLADSLRAHTSQFQSDEALFALARALALVIVNDFFPSVSREQLEDAIAWANMITLEHATREAGFDW